MALAVLLAGAVACAQTASGPAPPVDLEPRQITGFLTDVLFGGDEPTSDRAILALRRLREPSLRPLFSQMSGLGPGEGRNAALRRHGILGLAELATPARVDLLLLRTIDDRDERVRLLTEARDLGLLTVEDEREISRWPNLRPIVRVRMLGELLRAGEPIEASRLRELLTEEPPACVYASLLLIEQGGGREGVQGLQPGDRAPLDRLLARQVSQQPEIDVLIADIRRLDLQSGRKVVERVATEPQAPALLRFEAIWTLLSLAPEDAEVCAAWRAALEHSPDSASRARLGLAALEVARARRRPFGGDVFDAMRDTGDDLLLAMADAGRLVARRPDGQPVDIAPLLTLVQFAHEPTAAWVLHVAADLPAEQAGALQAAVILAARRGVREGYVAPVVQAAEALALNDPGRLATMLDDTVKSGDPLLVRAILAGALRAGTPEIVAITADIPEGAWPDEVCAAMVTLMPALHAEELTPERYADLAAIALATPGVDVGLRAQAAWLALQCRDEIGPALARIMAAAPQ